jgi:hypothetical protein
VAPLDARLHRPRRQYSYLLQRWLGAFVVDDAHAEAVKKLQAILGLTIPVKASEDLDREQAGDVEPFRDSRPVPPAATEEALLVVAAGGRLADRQRGGGRGVPPPGEGPAGTGRDAVASPGGAGDAGPSSDLPQRRVGSVLDVPCREGRRSALWRIPEGWIRTTQ